MSAEVDTSEEPDWGDYQSGPFCRHWGDPIDCDEACARNGCGHRCGAHDAAEGLTGCHECECEGWMEDEQ